MITSWQGLSFIRGYEKLRLQVYDGAGVLTVGYGHKVRAADGLKKGDLIGLPRAGTLYANDIRDAEAPVNALTCPLAQNEFDALVSFVFNCGRTAFASSTLRKRLL